ncbi:MAG TPA: FAD-dependent oxidoreductase [Planctomycetota bacterium]|nr:FAD-dependent oxidoreductase [Planctomycetota bacterium]
MKQFSTPTQTPLTPVAAALFLILLSSCLHAENVLIEAESFEDRGGWELDTQFIDEMGSPYLLAHGMGEPVKDASTTVTFPSTGTYKVFVRTKDWVAPWKAPGAPGKFQLLVDGKALSETFGTKGAEWNWQAGGSVEIKDKQVKIALHDLTGFEGRCDAILFTSDPVFTPPNDSTPLAQWRSKLLGHPEKPEEAGYFDLVVVGGGYGGMGAAIAAARMGCKVALIQNRGVLGGNGSSEVRVWAMGGTRTGLFPHLGDIVEEFTDRAKLSPGTYEEFGDAKKEALVRSEKNISLFLNHHAYSVEKEGNRITAVLAFSTVNKRPKKFLGKLFVDTTGHGSIGALAGADFTMQETGHMGMSNMWRWKNADAPTTFPEVPWALDLTMADFPYPQRFHAQWFWESGFNKHPIKELESTRDWNFRAIYGAFNAMKNKDGKEKHPNAKLEWVAYVGGTRESRQLLGDIILTDKDIISKKPFDDGCVPTTWDIDLHYPKEQYAKKFPNDPFISRAAFGSGVDRKNGYPVPYRCLYSRNVENLFMAGRCVSVTHEALGTVRVMKTGGMMGEVVGKAASICIKNSCTPRDVYAKHLEELKELMRLPGMARRETVSAQITTPAPPSTKDKEPRPAPRVLEGKVIDNKDAKLSGDWKFGHGLEGYYGEDYGYHGVAGKGSARFEVKVEKSGQYELRLAHQPHENRASNTAVSVESAEGTKSLTVNQKAEAPLNGFVSLGKFRFEAGKPGAVIVSNEGANGNVHIDALQIVPVQ